MKIYHSYELRWFSEKPLENTESFFANHGARIVPGSGRTDRYLVNGDDSYSLKVREGRLEVKIRTGKGKLIAGKGTPAWWTKWSYGLNNPVVRESFETGDYLDVAKDRTLLFTHSKSSELHLQSPGDTACQIEYGKITIGENSYFTFGLEAFSANKENMVNEFKHALNIVQPAFIDLSEIEPADYPDLLKSLS